MYCSHLMRKQIHMSDEYFLNIFSLNPITGGLFKTALKPFELLTYKFVTFPRMDVIR